MNIITEKTFSDYFSGNNIASIYGFLGNFEIISQNWHGWQSWLIRVTPGFQISDKTYLVARIKKLS